MIFTTGLKRIAFVILFLCIAFGINAQTLKGTVVDGESGRSLGTITVLNMTTQNYAYTNVIGQFTLPASAGDKVSFSREGYRTQFITVSADNMTALRIEMFKLSIQLEEFVYRPLYTPYQLDSMERKSTYQRALAREKGGSVMSPVTALAELFSKRSKQIYRFQKSFNYWESQKFIESRYSAGLVEQLTGLKGDTLAYFINANPIPYDYARAASELELKVWIRERYREWLKHPVYPAMIQAADTSKINTQ